MKTTDLKQHASWGLGLGMALLLAGCAVRPLPPYNPPPVADPARMPPPAQIQPIPPSTLPGQPPVTTQPVPPVSSDVSRPDESHLVALAADLSGAEVMPPTSSAGRGEFAAVYNRNTRQLRWKSSLQSLRGQITGVSFHGPADIDQNAPRLIEWNSAAGRSVYEGRATLTADQASQLLAGMWYVNVRTSAFPQGELRGQISIR